MGQLDSHRWQHATLRGTSVIVGDETVVLDQEGFVENSLRQKTIDRLNARTGAGWSFVAMNNDALWAGRLADSQRRVDSARLSVQEAERELIRKGDLLRTCEEQHKALEAERARYQAAVDGVAAASPKPAEPASAPLAPPVATPLKKKG